MKSSRVTAFIIGLILGLSGGLLVHADNQIKGPLEIEINVVTNKLYLLSNGKLIKEYNVSTGKSLSQTPTGHFTVRYKGRPNRFWKTPDHTESLGTRFIEFLFKNGAHYGIHGTNAPDQIGQSVSHGCVRMRNRDVEELYELVPLGTKVTIE